MKAKKTTKKQSPDIWVEMTGFKSEKDRVKCLALYKAGHHHEFRSSLLRAANGKLWFRVKARTFTGRQRTGREIKECVAYVNRKGTDNICRLLLGMLAASANRSDTQG